MMSIDTSLFLFALQSKKRTKSLIHPFFSLRCKAKREPVALKVQWHAGNTRVLPEQKERGG
jgi:hypothetical protein